MPRYEGRTICPSTGKYLSEWDILHSKGVCVHCGMVSGRSISHSTIEVGYWRPMGRFWLSREWVKK